MLNQPTQVNRRLPDFRSPVQLLRVIVFTQGLALLLAFAPFSIDSSPWYRLGFISMFLQWIALISCLTFSWFTPLLSRASFWQLALLIQGILLTITVGCTIISFWYFQQLAPTLELPALLINNLLICFVVALLVIQLVIMSDEQSKSITAQSRAELIALQARIRPHFLFNTLNSTAELVHQNAAAAEQALLDLAASETISLTEELALCRRYLSLEQWRLGERLKVNWQLPEPMPELQLPALTLQPLLENAVLHGIEPAAAGGEILIKMTQTAQQLQIVITNPYPLQGSRQPHNGMALQNIQQRLAYVFAEQAQMVIKDQNQQFSVTLVLPLVWEQR
ncbi:MAG: alginate biosynthesis protein [Alishewanella sp. 34-51-39]|nr:MAG: alginate biosynthesis protein [Alishewanella sp. 34-51-39]